MGTLFRLLLKLCGRNVFAVARLSEVSKTVESLPGPKRVKWFWGGLLHIFPVALVLVLLFGLRASEIRHSAREVIALLLASAWAWLGPVLIWYYEKVTLPRFAQNCRAVIADTKDYRLVRKAIYSNIYALDFCKYFTPIWMVIASIAYFSAYDFVTGFGVRGYKDVFWWLIFFGVLLVAYYTSIGFCFSYKAYHLTKIVSRARLDRRIYYVDGVFGLSFIGDFAFITAAMFFSGWLFAPLIILSVNQKSLWQYLYSTPVLLLGIYFVFTLLSFLIPIYIIHHKILREKLLRSESFYKIANELTDILGNPISEDHLKRFDFAKKLIAEVQAIPNWPLRVDTALKFSLTSIFIPTLAGLFSAILKAKTGAP